MEKRQLILAVDDEEPILKLLRANLSKEGYDVAAAADGESALAICQGYEILASDPNKILREILEVLQHDGYLAQEADRFVFISHLLKDWWKARFAFGYTPVVEWRA